MVLLIICYLLGGKLANRLRQTEDRGRGRNPARGELNATISRHKLEKYRMVT